MIEKSVGESGASSGAEDVHGTNWSSRGGRAQGKELPMSWLHFMSGSSVSVGAPSMLRVLRIRTSNSVYGMYGAQSILLIARLALVLSPLGN